MTVVEERKKTRQRGRPSRSESEEIRNRLLAVAAETFISAGYGKTSIALIAQKADITKKTLYRHFTDKKSIFAAVIKHRLGKIPEVFDANEFDQADMEETLLALGWQWVENWTPSLAEIVRLVYAEAPRFPELGAILQELASENEHYVARVLARFAEPETDLLAAARIFVEMIHMRPQRWLLLQPSETYPEKIKRADLEIAVKFFAASWREVCCPSEPISPGRWE
jgi:AcrR family transcriptional regulator